MRYLKIIIISFVFVISACKHVSPFEGIDPDTIKDPVVSTNCDSDTVYFVNVIKPLINNSCATTNCHDASSAREGVVLDTYANIIVSGEVKPGKPYDSKLYEVITDSGEDAMPPNNSLSSEQISVIKKWIEQGALNNECDEGECITTNMSYANDIWPTISNNCTSCHSGGSPSGGVSIVNYSDVKVLVDNSKLVNVLYGKNGSPLMPPNGQLSKCDIDQIEQWIKDGASDN